MKTERLSDWAMGRLTVALLLLVFGFNGCKQRDPLAEERAALDAAAVRLRGCLPQPTPVNDSSREPRLAIVEITRQPQTITVQLAAVAGAEAVEFYLPVYLMSAGRWLINERERAYVLDERCGEHKLQDRKPVGDKRLPLDGKVSLKAGEAFSFKLVFPMVPDELRLGALVYGSTVLPLALLNR